MTGIDGAIKLGVLIALVETRHTAGFDDVSIGRADDRASIEKTGTGRVSKHVPNEYVQCNTMV